MSTVYFESLFESVCQNLKLTNNLDIISNQFMKLTTDRDRISYLLQLDVVHNHLRLPDNCQSLVSAGGKSSDLATKFRAEGNQYFKERKYMAALEKYTESLSYAPLPQTESGSGDNMASLALANRSAAFFQLGKHELCLSDICQAFSMGYPPALAYKLYDRKGQCFLALGRRSEAASSFRAALDALAAACDLESNRHEQWQFNLRKRIQSCDQKHQQPCSAERSSVELCAKFNDIPQIPECERHSQFESLSDACDVVYDPCLGRYIVAKRDISPGEVILSEKPYASIMLADSRLDHCSHCYSFTLAPIPCHSCHHSLYCSAECRSLAYQLYHRAECRLGEILEASGVDKFAFLALRTLVVTPLDVVGQYCESLPPHEVGGKNAGVYRADSYDAICGLVTHAEDRTAHDLFRRAAIAIFLLRCLCFVGFFETENPPEEILSGAGGLLLSHLQSFPCNAHEVAEFDLDPETVATSMPHELGAGIYATLSLFNHSCNPAVTRNFYGDCCVVRTIRPVRAGDELSDNYGAVFAMQTRRERHAKLLPQYFFECRCKACEEDWPLYSTLREMGPKWRCCTCSAALPSCGTTCGQCGAETKLAECVEKLRKSDNTYKNAFAQLLRCRVAEALPGFFSHLQVMSELLCPPCADYGACQEAVKQCFSIMANCRCIRQEKDA